MYLDFIKLDYNNKSKEERIQLINRDKNHLGKIIQSRITDDIENIVDRWYELEDIGVVEEEGMFLKLLKEAEELYSFGYFIGAISLIGVASEELCKIIIQKNGLGTNEITQFNRINLISTVGKISKETEGYLHKIRKIRNHYIHSNSEGIYIRTNEIRKKSFTIITLFKSVLKDTLQVTDINYSDVLDKLISNQEFNFTDFKYRYRNLLHQEKSIDLQLEVTNKPRVITSIFSIYDIDIQEEEFKELTLIDIENGLPVTVDLTIPKVKEIKKLKLEKNNGIIATLISTISSIGQTEEWMLLEIHEVYRGELNLSLV
ncbi:hypothetical protein [Metabacillus fastidiosus]|uniref:hypothetical protein n=1 Tax=Metabacillus fastidiosus TaxID=1458 RepID=UPI003D28D88B